MSFVAGVESNNKLCGQDHNKDETDQDYYHSELGRLNARTKIDQSQPGRPSSFGCSLNTPGRPALALGQLALATQNIQTTPGQHRSAFGSMSWDAGLSGAAPRSKNLGQMRTSLHHQHSHPTLDVPWKDQHPVLHKSPAEVLSRSNTIPRSNGSHIYLHHPMRYTHAAAKPFPSLEPLRSVSVAVSQPALQEKCPSHSIKGVPENRPCRKRVKLDIQNSGRSRTATIRQSGNISRCITSQNHDRWSELFRKKFKNINKMSRTRLISCCGTILLLIAVPIAFLAFNWSWMIKRNRKAGIIGLVAYFYLLGIMFSSMWLTSFGDPGIVPRDLGLESDESAAKTYDEENGTKGKLPSAGPVDVGEIEKEDPPVPKTRWVQGPDNQLLPIKWCQVCRTYRAPRTAHCRLCDHCVEHSDHHCIFLNNCIGSKNYLHFFVFLTSILFLIIFMDLVIWTHLIEFLGSENRSKQPPRDYRAWGSLLVFVICTILGLPALGLWIFHFQLILKNMTTAESIKVNSSQADSFMVQRIKSHSLEDAYQNSLNILCKPIRSS